MTITKNTGEICDLDLHQEIALDHLYANPRAGLFLEMSLSKTVVTLLYLYDMIYHEAAITKTLIVSTKNVVRLTWPEQIKTWQEVSDFRYSVIHGDIKQRTKALEADADIYLISVDNLEWLLDKYVYQPRSKTGVTKYPWQGSIPFDCVVLDESSLFKSWGSERFKKLDRALEMSDVPYRIALTGTPAPNGEKDLWAQMKLLDGGQRLGAQVGPFIEKYFTTRGNGMIIYEYTTKPGAASEIARRISDIVLSLNAKDVDIKLPDIHIRDVMLELTDLEREVYDELEREYCLDFFSGESTTVKTSADLVNKLLQITAGAIYEDKEEGKPRVWHELNTVKLDAMANIFDRHPDENFLIVYQFRHELERILERFPDAVALPQGKKLNEVFDAWNRGEIKKLVIHPASAGHGLNIQTGGRHIVWATPSWNLEHWLQTIARLRRRGGFDEIYVWLMMVRKTQDQRVKKRFLAKGTDQQFLMDEVKFYKQRYEIR